MTALNPDLLRRIERRLDDVGRLASKTFAPVILDKRPGIEEAGLCTAAAIACAQVQTMIERRFAVFRAESADQELVTHVAAVERALTELALLIRAQSARQSLRDHLETVFDQLAAAITVIGRLRRPVSAT